MFFYIEYILQLFKNLFEFVIMNMIKLNIEKKIYYNNYVFIIIYSLYYIKNIKNINNIKNTLTNESYRLLYIL